MVCRWNNIIQQVFTTFYPINSHVNSPFLIGQSCMGRLSPPTLGRIMISLHLGHRTWGCWSFVSLCFKIYQMAWTKGIPIVNIFVSMSGICQRCIYIYIYIFPIMGQVTPMFVSEIHIIMLIKPLVLTVKSPGCPRSNRVGDPRLWNLFWWELEAHPSGKVLHSHGTI